MELKRYDIEHYGYDSVKMEESPNGDWVDFDDAESIIAQRDQLLGSLEIMTSFVRIKYGNLDADVYAEIEKSEALIAAAKGEV